MRCRLGNRFNLRRPARAETVERGQGGGELLRLPHRGLELTRAGAYLRMDLVQQWLGHRTPGSTGWSVSIPVRPAALTGRFGQCMSPLGSTRGPSVSRPAPAGVSGVGEEAEQNLGYALRNRAHRR